jgi:Kef-type K+ transport system membrane component KefB
MTASVHATETLLFTILLQLVVMIGAARLLNVVFRRLGQPGVIGEIVAGLLLGPSLFGHFFPGLSVAVFGAGASPPVTIISQIGLTLLMFQIGCEFEFGHLRSDGNGSATGWVALASILVPAALGFGFGQISADRLAPGIDKLTYSLFCGVAMAITAVPILGRILREFGLTGAAVGVVAITAAAINDVVGWLLLACISAYATAQLSVAFVLLRALAVAILGAVLWFVLRPAVKRLLRVFPLRRDDLDPNLMAIVLCLIFLLGMVTYSIGIFTIFGGFAAGLLFHRHPDFTRAWRRQVGQFVLVFFLPIFFTYTGLRTNVLGLSLGEDMGWLGLVLAAAILGKLVPVYVAGRVCGFGHWRSAVLGALMNTRALMELIVLNVGFDLGFIPAKVFTMLVIMAVVTTVMTGPLLQILLPRMGHRMVRQVEA